MIQEKKAYSILRNISQSRLYCIWTSLVVLRRVKDTSLGRFVQKWSCFDQKQPISKTCNPCLSPLRQSTLIKVRR